MAASVEYAVDVLGVPTIVVCGHSGCGAMETALSTARTGESATGALGRWLAGAEASVTAWLGDAGVGCDAAAEGRDEADQLAMVNVAVQLRRLAEHYVVARAIDEGRVRLVGLYFDIPVARMLVLEGRRFVPASADRLGAGTTASRVDQTATPANGIPLPRRHERAAAGRTASTVTRGRPGDVK